MVMSAEEIKAQIEQLKAKQKELKAQIPREKRYATLVTKEVDDQLKAKKDKIENKIEFVSTAILVALKKL